MGRINVLLVMVPMMLGVTAAQADTLYKWVDSQGHVSYHDQPPSDGAGYRVEEKVLGSSHKPQEGETLADIIEKYPVVLYSVPDCDSCNLARLYLQKRKVPFTEQNLSTDPKLQQIVKKKTGSLSAPTIMIGEKVMKGYVESVLEGELDDVGYPKVAAPESSAGDDRNKDNPPAGDNSGR